MTPNPGSDAAIALGCICPVLDNCRGKFPPYGTDENGDGIWIQVVGCPVHDGEAA